MKNFFSLGWRCIGIGLSLTLSSSANPDPPAAFPVLSEIQVTDSLHWNVEVDASIGGMSYYIKYPCQTDTMLLFCWNRSTQPPADSMRRPAIHEVFDSKGISVLTPAHFPGLKLVKGAYVFLQVKLPGYTNTWQVQIPSNLSSTQSVVGAVEQYCCEYDSGRCDMYCPRPVYSISNHPTIGLPNRYAGVSPPTNTSSTAGSVRLLSPRIHGQIALAVSGTLIGQGTIDIFAADGSLTRSLSFTSRGPGTYTVRWDGCSERNQTVPAGTYICRVKIGEDISCKGFIAW